MLFVSKKQQMFCIIIDSVQKAPVSRLNNQIDRIYNS